MKNLRTHTHRDIIQKHTKIINLLARKWQKIFTQTTLSEKKKQPKKRETTSNEANSGTLINYKTMKQVSEGKLRENLLSKNFLKTFSRDWGKKFLSSTAIWTQED